MFFVTGDTHRYKNIEKLNIPNFGTQESLSKKDFVLITGDFGGIWDGSEKDISFQKLLQEKKFTTLFVDGNHENFEQLNKYPVSTWNGGKVHFINDSIIHLMRGQVYNIDGYKIFTMGGAESIDKTSRFPYIDWWSEELPNYIEYNEALENLDRHEWNVDYVFTHTCPKSIYSKKDFYDKNQLDDFFEMLVKRLSFKKWYFGHFHEEKEIKEKYCLMFNNIEKVFE